jgi:hypothetical protein
MRRFVARAEPSLMNRADDGAGLDDEGPRVLTERARFLPGDADGGSQAESGYPEGGRSPAGVAQPLLIPA